MQVKIPIGQKPYYNIDPVSKTAQVSDSVIDGYIDESGTVRRRRGLKPYFNIEVGSNGQGLYYWPAMDLLITVAGGQIFKNTSLGISTEITGVTLSKTTVITFAAGNKIDGTPWLYIMDGGYPVYTLGTTATRLTISSGAPANCTSMAWSAGRFLAMDNGTRNFYVTDVNPGTGDIENDYFLSSDNPLTAEYKPDFLEYIGSSWDEVLVWGREGLEVWRADDTFFSPIQGAFSPVGLLAKYSVAEGDNTVLALCAVDGGAKRAVVKLNGRTPQVVSLPIENILAEYAVVSDAIGFMTNDSNYILTFPTEGVTWCYNYRDDKWYQYSYWNAFSATREEFLCRYSASCWGKTFMQSRSDGQVFVFDSATYTDGGATINTEFITGNITHESYMMKRNHNLMLMVKRGVGSVGSPASLILRWKDNNESFYQTGKQRTINLDETGNTECFIKTTLLGIYRSRKYSFSITDNADLAIVGIEENVERLSK